jgi:hypothetical protein
VASNSQFSFVDNRGPSSRPLLVDLQEWWAVWGPKVAAHEGKQGWILLLLDALDKVVKMQMTMSRLLRKKPAWDSSGWSEDEWRPVSEVAAEGAAWFHENRPRLEDVPEWAQFLFVAIHSIFAAHQRLAAELEEVMHESHLLVNLTPALERPGEYQEVES